MFIENKSMCPDPCSAPAKAKTINLTSIFHPSLHCISFFLFIFRQKKNENTKCLAYEHNLKCIFVCHSQLQRWREEEEEEKKWNKMK